MKNVILIFLTLFLIYNLFFIFKKRNKYNKNKKTILITGSSDGVGKEFVYSLNPNIYQVIITGRCKDKISKVVQYARHKKIDNIGIPCDFSDNNQIYNLYNKSIRYFGKIDILVNNMYNMDKVVSLGTSSNIEIINHINTNISNVLVLTKLVIQNMTKKNLKGRIINIGSKSSTLSYDKNDYIDLYATIKTFIEKYTKVLSKSSYKDKISVCCLRIDDSFKTTATKKFLKTYDSLRKPDALISVFKYILNSDWRNITGKIISSSEFEKNNDLSSYELNFEKGNRPNLYDYHKNNKSKKLAIGENYIGMSPKINKFFKGYKWNFSKYSSDNSKLINKLSSKHNVSSENIILNNGTAITLYLILSKFIKQDHDIICCNPSWLIFDHFAELNNLNVIKSDLKIQNNKFSVNFDDILLKITSLTRIIYLIMPVQENELSNFVNKMPDGIIIVLDFCYYDFLDDNFNVKQIIDNKQIICLFSFSKFYGLANLQLGYVITNQLIINLLKLCQITQVPTFKEEIALIALNDKSHNNKVKDYYSNEKTKIFNVLKNHKIEYIDSFQNFIYIKFNKKESLKNELKKYDINYDYSVDLEGYVILVIHSPEYNKRVLDSIINLT